MQTISKILFFLTFFLSISFAGVCPKPIAGTITNSGVMANQKINLSDLVIDGNDNGEGLYYKIQLSSSGKLILNTTDESTKSDKVNTYGQLLRSDCSTFLDPNDIQTNSNPRYFKFDWDLSTATYYLRVYNKYNIHDVGGNNKTGYFRLLHTFTPLVATKGVSITKTSSPSSSMNSGSSITYTLYVKNTGSQATTSVTLSDSVPTHLDYVGKVGSTDWTCGSGDPVVCTYNGGIITSGATKQLKLEYKSNTYSTSSRTASGTSTVVSGYADSTTQTDSAARSITIKKVTPSIKIDKTASSMSVLEDEIFDYRFKVTNNSTDVTDTNVRVTGSISSDFDIVSIDFDGAVWKNCSYDAAKSYSCELINDLLPSASKYFEIKVKAVGDPANPELVTHYAVVNSDTNPDVGHLNESDSIKVTIVAKNPSIGISKTSNEVNVIKDHTQYYTVAVYNNGNVPLTNVVITDNVPSQVDVISVSGAGWDCSASNISTNSINCTYAALPIGVGEEIQIGYKGITIANNVINTASVVSSEGATGNNPETINIIAPSPGIRIRKNAPVGVESLEEFKYTLTVDNNGSETNSNIVVTDSLDPQLTFVDWGSTNSLWWNCSISGQDITCNYNGTLNPGQYADSVIEINVKAPYTASDISINNTAVVTTDSGATTISDSDTVTTGISEARVGFFTTKRSTKSVVKSGESYMYTINVENNGTLGEQNIKVLDTLDPLITNFTLNANGWDCSNTSGNNIDCRLASLAPNEVKNFTIDVVAPVVSSATVITNTSNATSDIIIPPHINTSKSDTHSVDVTINPADSNLNIIKNSSKDIILENDIFSYIIKVDNNSVSDEHNLTVTDTIHSDLNIVSINGGGDWSCIQSGQLITCDMTKLIAKTVASDINITVKAPVKISTDHTIPNSAKVVSSKETVGKNANKDVTLLSHTNAIKIHMKSNPDTVYINDLYYYTIFITNNSAKNIDGIKLTEILPVELQYDHYVSGGWNCDYNNTSREFSCDNNGTKFTGGEKIIELYVIAPNYEVNVTNTISLTTDLDPYIRDANVTTEVIAKEAKLRYKKAEADKSLVAVGENFTYTLQVENYGTAPDSDLNVTNLKIEFNLDANVSYQSYASTGWSCSYAASILTCDLPYLAAGQSSDEINITVKATNKGQIKSTANLTADQLESADAEVIVIGVDAKEVVNIDISLNLNNSLDSVEGGTNYYYNASIVNHDALKKAEGVVLEINTTSANDYTYVGIDNSTDWSCSKSSRLLTCQLQKDLLPNTTEILKIEVTAPNSVTTIDVNAILYSDFVNDTNPANNSVTENTDIKITDLTADNPREFTKVKLQGMEDLNILGDLITIGNQSICQQLMGVCVEPWHPVNDLVTQEYINLDPTAGAYKNSTKAKLELQAGDKIVWAGLYWMGRVDKGQAGWLTLRDNASKVYLRADSNTSGYIEVQADRASKSIDSNGSEVTVDKFNFINGNDYFDYQGVADVTDYVKANGAGDYWVGDIKSSEGDNLSAGWNLVVIVRDTKTSATRGLKNITIFDGFQGVWKSTYNANALTYPDEVNQSVSGILTPSSGPVESKLIFFGFEGDESLKDFIKVDGVALSDVKGTADDVVNGTISKNGLIVNTRSPALQNTSGIDVDEFNVGDSGHGIIKNAQTSVDISIGSDEDRFFLGMFGFSTSLKDPVCYVQKLYNDDYTSLLTEAHIGDKIGIEVMFKNVETQTLYDTHTFSQIDNIFKEDNSSFRFKNVGEACFADQSSLFIFSEVFTSDGNLTEVKTSIGAGASGLSGGDFVSNDEVFIRYIATIDESSDDNLTHNVYSISYSPTPNKKIQVSSCDGKDQNLTILLNEPKGFQVVHEGIDVNTDKFIDINASSSNEAHLFTQVQNNNFGVDIVHIKPNSNNGEIEGYTGRVMVELVDMSDYNASIVGSCESLASISSPVYEAFDSSKPKYKNKILSYDNAVKSAGYRATYLVDKYNRELWNDSNYASVGGADILSKLDAILKDDPHGDKRCENSCTSDWTTCSQCVYKSVVSGGLGRSSCSVDKFSVKPENISISSSGGNKMIGADNYDLSLTSGAGGYDQNVTIGMSGSLDYNLTNPGGCDGNLTGTLYQNEVVSFIDGNASLTNFTYKNIGDLTIDFVDFNWTKTDQDSNINMTDCVIGSSNNTPNADGKVGCDVSGSEQFSFEPERYDSRITSLINFSSGFTYLSNDTDMSAPLTFEVIAVMADGNAATNFESACYATDVNYTLSMSGVSGTPLYSGTSDGKFNISESNFTNGRSSQIVGLNVQRFANKPRNPFVINSGDIGIGVEDNGTYGKSGLGFSVEPDHNATFYFGRLHVPDIQTPQESIIVKFNYEVYCDSYNPSIFTLSKGSESPDSVHWYNNNANHTISTQGEYTSLNPKNYTNVASIVGSIYDVNASLGGLITPHRDRVHFEADSWLLFNKQKSNPADDSFNIHFTSRSNSWAGKGKMGKSVDNNLSKRSTKKMEW